MEENSRQNHSPNLLFFHPFIMAQFTHTNWEPKVLKIVMTIVLAIVALIVFFSSWKIVWPWERTLVVRLGNISRELDSGLHFKLPIIEDAVTFDVRTQKDNFDVTAASKDLQTVSANVAVNYNLDITSVTKMYTEVGKDYIWRILLPAVHESVKASTAQFSADELITKRSAVKDTMFKILSERMITRGIIVTDVSIVDFNFSESFNQAIESKVTAEQSALAQKNKLEQVKYEAEQRVTQAKAEAEAIRIQAQAVTSQWGADYVKLKWVEKWNWALPTTQLGDSMPLINLK